MTPVSEQEFTIGLDWLLKNTTFPTFQEFCKNPDAWRTRSDEILALADKSTDIGRERLVKQKYSWRDQYTFDSLEQIERVSRDEGFALTDLEMEPLVTFVSGTSNHHKSQYEILVRFWPKGEFKARGGVVTNDQG